MHEDVALAVGGPAAVPAAVDLGELERRCVPSVFVEWRLDVVVCVEQDGRCVGISRRRGNPPRPCCRRPSRPSGRRRTPHQRSGRAPIGLPARTLPAGTAAGRRPIAARRARRAPSRAKGIRASIRVARSEPSVMGQLPGHVVVELEVVDEVLEVGELFGAVDLEDELAHLRRPGRRRGSAVAPTPPVPVDIWASRVALAECGVRVVADGAAVVPEQLDEDLARRGACDRWPRSRWSSWAAFSSASCVVEPALNISSADHHHHGGDDGQPDVEGTPLLVALGLHDRGHDWLTLPRPAARRAASMRPCVTGRTGTERGARARVRHRRRSGRRRRGCRH